MFKYLPYILHILYFNFRYFPFTQAVRLPVWLHKPKFRNLKGAVRIDSTRIETGMIRLGVPMTTIYPDRGISFDNQGTIIFKGRCNINSYTAIAVGEQGVLTLGDGFAANDRIKIICFHSVTFGKCVHLGWNVTVVDTDFHCMKNAVTHKKQKAFAPIEINDYTWIGQSTHLLKGTKTPAHTIIGAASVLTGKYKCEENSIISGNPAVVVAEGCYYRDFGDDRVDYPVRP